ncbi:hypothetical protein [Allosphingosinicella deserti]|jgi:hypothetical protein|uniref:Uncharacterized protein n=1 Tax=Allosphingosinicella deserti TaxID=2116704 RepID=A0A2P7QUY5_9SPHN|nr:hypothetical protein [Sphingomonas deserti]PSJ41763.1 hypothetical protein C7I55_05625 [Sphingomonas deserti]
MLRAILIIVALIILVLIGMTATGWLTWFQTPNGQTTSLNPKVNDLEVGTTTANVQVPNVGTTTKQVDVPVVTVDNQQ